MKHFLIILILFLHTSLFVSANDDSMQSNRPFHMGMTPWPYDFSESAKIKTYRILKQYTDLVAHHLDEGIPWPEALNNKAYHQNVENNIKFRLKNTPKSHKIFLAVTPISISRNSLAGYWGENTSMPLTGKWKGKDFDDKMVIKAYLNFCNNLIKRFKPDYFAYGIEVNLLAKNDSKKYHKFETMAKSVYRNLKKNHPKLPIFVTFKVEEFLEDEKTQKTAIKRLLPYTDYIAISSYPYSISNDPQKLPKNLFSELHELAPDKPFAVAETGFIAEDLHISDYNIFIKGTETWQANYVNFLLLEASKLKAQFVVWFVSRDYDLGWIKLKNMGVSELFKVWRDTGLLDGKGKKRKALKIWNKWLQRKK
jgi:hypothetical protein